MNDYIVLARKYRPESFETLIGQDNIATTLKNSILRGQLAHAYLFCGPRGVGKTTTARIFAKMINCSSPLENGEPCGECESCLSFAEGRSYCIHELDAASNNSVEDIKEIIDKVRVAPQVGKYSVYIIDEVHMLSSAAFNAFLKTLEEPPEYAIFILATTEKHKILPTILSRCQTYDFNRMSISDIVRNLRMIASKENITVDDESLHVIAIKADGAMRDALTIFDQTIAFCGTDIKYEDVVRNLNVLDYDYCFNLTDNFLAGDYASALRTFDDILSKGFNALHFVSALSSHLRDLMVAKAGGIDALLELADSLKARYRAQAASCSEKFLYDALAITTQCEQLYKASVNPRLHIEFALMKLSFLCKQPAAPAQQPAAAPAPAPAPAQPAPAPASAPVPQPAPEPKAAPAPAVQAPEQPSAPQEAKPSRRAPVGGAKAAVSIKTIAEEKNSSEQASSTTVEDRDLADDELNLGWHKLCELFKNNERQYVALTSAKLSISRENDMILFTYAVVNESLRMWFSERNSRIEAKFRELVGSSKVRLILDVQPEDPSTRIVVSAEDKAREMMEANPKVNELITGLGLELK